MKKYLSIFKLLVRSTFWKVLLLFVVMTVGQVILFFAYGAGEEAYLYEALLKIPTAAVIRLGAWALFLVLIGSMTDQGGRMNHLLLRLGISEKSIYWIHVVYNTLIVGLFFLLQGFVYLVYCGIYACMTPGQLDPMTVFAAAYQHPVFHRFFPLHDMVAWVENLTLILGFGICTAATPVRARRKLLNINAFLLLAFSLPFMTPEGPNHLGSGSLGFVLLLTMPCVFLSLWGVLTLEVDDDGKA